jgi:hypothetical protein
MTRRHYYQIEDPLDAVTDTAVRYRDEKARADKAHAGRLSIRHGLLVKAIRRAHDELSPEANDHRLEDVRSLGDFGEGLPRAFLNRKRRGTDHRAPTTGT